MPSSEGGRIRDVANEATGDCDGKPIGDGRQGARHESAIAVAREHQLLRIGYPFGDKGFDRFEQVCTIRLAPAVPHTVEEVVSVAVTSTRIDHQDRVSERNQFRVVGVHEGGGTGPGIMRPTMDVQDEWSGAREVRVAQDPTLNSGAVADVEPTLGGDGKRDVSCQFRVQFGDDLDGASLEIDDGDLTEGRRRCQRDDGPPGYQGQAGDHCLLSDEKW
ncbi:hypothetical protein GCM10020255_107300 [Rhodococcus baikonurensis]